MTTLTLFVCLFVSHQEQYILIACDSKIEEAIQNRVDARDAAHSEKRVSRKTLSWKSWASWNASRKSTSA